MAVHFSNTNQHATITPREIPVLRTLPRLTIGRILFDSHSQISWIWLTLCALISVSWIPSIIQGQRHPLSVFISLPHILMGLLMAFLVSKNYFKTLKLLRHGIATTGIFLKKRRTYAAKRHVYQYVFAIEVDGKQYHHITNHPRSYDFNDGASALIFYDPNDPTNGVVFDFIAGNPKISYQGIVSIEKTWSNLKYIIAPMMSLIGIVVFLLVERHLNNLGEAIPNTHKQTIPSNDPYALLVNNKERSISMMTCIRVLFGGLRQELGWALLAFSLPFIIVFIPPKSVQGVIFQFSKTASTTGIVEQVSKTNTSQNRRMVYAAVFQFEANDRLYRNTSYSTIQAQPKQPVTIEYRPSNPHYSRIQGMDFSNLGGGSGFYCLTIGILLFPTIGLGLVLKSAGKNIASRNLLVWGTPVQGTFKERIKTEQRIGEKWVYKLIFTFTDDTGQSYEAQCTDEAWPDYQDREVILYNPTNPRQAVVYGAIPGRVQITNQGHVFSPQRWHSIQCLIAPILSIALIGVIVSIMIKGLP